MTERVSRDESWPENEPCLVGEDEIATHLGPGPIDTDNAGDGSDTRSPTLALAPHQWSPWFSVFWLLIASVAFWGIGSATASLVGLWQQNLVLGVPLALIGLVLLAFLVRALWLEWLAIQDVDALAERREKIEQARLDKDSKALKEAFVPTVDNLRSREPKLIDEFEAAVVDVDDCTEYLRCFESIVLCSLDAKADRVVQNGAIATGAAVAIVPHPAFDAVVVLWRALVMTRQIGAIYGLRPGGIASWRLLSHALKSALLAASVETVSTLLTESFATTLASALKSVAQGLVIGLRVYHVGRLTISVCRPV